MLIISFVISWVVYLKTKRKTLTLFLFSILGNLSLYLNIESEFFISNDLMWLAKFTINYWPWINLGLFIILIINYLKNKNEKTKNF